jgi:hypothetical protein
MQNSWLRGEPAFHRQTGDASKLVEILGQKRCAKTDCIGCDEKVYRADGLSAFLKRGANHGVGIGCFAVEIHNPELGKEYVKLGQFGGWIGAFSSAGSELCFDNCGETTLGQGKGLSDIGFSPQHGNAGAAVEKVEGHF